jgi:RNA polymerase subunit RPABC4/transcription elongation factor Spt4
VAKEVQRTCKRCETVWYLSIKAAKERMPDRMMALGIRMQAAGTRMSIGSRHKTGAETQLANIESRIARVTRNRSCPNCGSQSFTEKKVKV